jgi:hypothetical protein
MRILAMVLAAAAAGCVSAGPQGPGGTRPAYLEAASEHPAPLVDARAR